MSKEKKKKLTLKNFKGTPRKYNDNSSKTQGKVVVEQKNPTFRTNKSKTEKKPIKSFAPKIAPPFDDKQKMPKNGQRKKFRKNCLRVRKKLKKNLKEKDEIAN